jgi:thiol-disulfide isomerase/thioredoxin
MHALRKAVTIGTIALTYAVPHAAQAQEAGVAIGASAPNATLETIDSVPRSVQLSRYIGQTPVVLEFWAHWCGNCRALESQLTQAATQFGRRVKFVAVAVSANQTPEQVRRYMQTRRLPVEMLYDRTGAAGDAYDIPATSYIVVIDRAGKVVYTGAGRGQDLMAAVRKAL